jgi:hypothetical protein
LNFKHRVDFQQFPRQNLKEDSQCSTPSCARHQQIDMIEKVRGFVSGHCLEHLCVESEAISLCFKMQNFSVKIQAIYGKHLKDSNKNISNQI